MILSWYEQKACVILLSLLHLGIKDIRLGPSLPAFITPNVLDVLVKNFNIMPIGTPMKTSRRFGMQQNGRIFQRRHHAPLQPLRTPLCQSSNGFWLCGLLSVCGAVHR
jgi:hydroxylamine reductase (hybrid-cluster protein)